MKDGATIALKVGANHINHWRNEVMPVILILYDAAKDEAYWLYVQQYLEARTADGPTNGQKDRSRGLRPVPAFKIPEVLVRVAAAEILGEVGSSADVSRLVHALRSADWLVRAHAADSLGALGYKRARPALVRTVTEDPQPIVRRDAAAALGQQGDQAVVPILERLLADEKEEQARLGLLEALYCLGQRERLPSLLSLFQSNDDTLRHAVLNSVEATVMPEDAPLAVQAIREFLEDEDNPGVRADAERVLSELLRPACNESEHSRLG